MTKNVCFVICPIGSEGSLERKRADHLLKYIIEKSLNGLNYTIIRADKISKPGDITSQIIENLIEADIVIADLYNHNPNVFYELGIRHSVNKPVIQLYYPGQRIPFDVSGLRSIKLDINDLESADKCISELNKQIRTVEKNPNETTSPFSIAIDLQTLKSTKTSTEVILRRILDNIEKLRSEMLPKERSTLEAVLPRGKDQYFIIRYEKGIIEMDILNIRIELMELSLKKPKTMKDKEYREDLLKQIEVLEYKRKKLDHPTKTVWDYISE